MSLLIKSVNKREDIMEDTPKKTDWKQEVREGKTPEIVKKEQNDKPAANVLRWTIAIAVVVLLIIYWLFFYLPGQS